MKKTGIYLIFSVVLMMAFSSNTMAGETDRFEVYTIQKSTGTVRGVMNAGDFNYKQDAEGNIKITKYHGTEKVVNIPSTIGGDPVTAIGKMAFVTDVMKEVIIPDTVVSLKTLHFFHAIN